MTSAIDPTKPVDGVPASKADLRANLAAAKSEIEALQGGIGSTGNLPNILDLGAAGNSNGSTGNGTDDTTAIQSALDTYGVVFVPADHIFRITASLILPTKGGLVGAGSEQSIIFADAVTGPAIRFAPAGGEDESDLRDHQRLEHLQIMGMCDTAVYVYFALQAYIADIYFSGTATDGFYFYWTFGSTFIHLSTDGATLARGSAFEEADGAAYRIGGTFNANFCADWYHGGSYVFHGIYYEDGAWPAGSSFGNTFSQMTMQGCRYGINIVSGHGISINGMYTENTSVSLRLGDDATSKIAFGISVNGGTLGGPGTEHPYYSTRTACVELSYAYGVTLNGLNFDGVQGTPAIVDAIHYRNCGRVVVFGSYIIQGLLGDITTWIKRDASAGTQCGLTIFQAGSDGQTQLILKTTDFAYKHYKMSVDGSGAWVATQWIPTSL